LERKEAKVVARVAENFEILERKEAKVVAAQREIWRFWSETKLQ
jgi:hypothetical protein